MESMRIDKFLKVSRILKRRTVAQEACAGGKVSVTLDELQLPGTLISGKVSFPSGGSGSWFIDQAGRLGWSDLSGKPTQYEMQDFQTQLMQMLQGAM